MAIPLNIPPILSAQAQIQAFADAGDPPATRNANIHESLKWLAAKLQPPAMPEGAAVHLYLDEGQRQVNLLALALLSLDRPGWEYMFREIAAKMELPDSNSPNLFDSFRGIHKDRPKVQDAMRFDACDREAAEDRIRELESQREAAVSLIHEHERKWENAIADLLTAGFCQNCSAETIVRNNMPGKFSA